MYYSYVEIEYTSFSPARMDLAVKLLIKYPYRSPPNPYTVGKLRLSAFRRYRGLGVMDRVFLTKYALAQNG
jgi:hypothetical protein